MWNRLLFKQGKMPSGTGRHFDLTLLTAEATRGPHGEERSEAARLEP
jgi:hypothetical protein